MAALIVLWIGLWIAGVTGRTITKVLGRTQLDQTSKSYFNDSRVSNGVGIAVKYFLILLTLLMVLQLLNFTSVLNHSSDLLTH
jgi:hypothetical protein